MSTNLEYRERGERDREKEKVGRQTSEEKLNEKKSYSEREKAKETLEEQHEFCSGDKKMHEKC